MSSDDRVPGWICELIDTGRDGLLNIVTRNRTQAAMGGFAASSSSSNKACTIFDGPSTDSVAAAAVSTHQLSDRTPPIEPNNAEDDLERQSAEGLGCPPPAEDIGSISFSSSSSSVADQSIKRSPSLFSEYQTKPGGDTGQVGATMMMMMEKMNDTRVSYMTGHRNVTGLDDIVGHRPVALLPPLVVEEEGEAADGQVVTQLELDATVEGREDAMRAVCSEVISLNTTHTASGNLAIVLPLNNADMKEDLLAIEQQRQQHQQHHDQTGNVELLSAPPPPPPPPPPAPSSTTAAAREGERLAANEQRRRRRREGEEEAGHQTIEAGDDGNDETLSEFAVRVPLLETAPRLLLLFTVRRLQIEASCCCCPDRHCQGQHCCHSSTRFRHPNVDDCIDRINVVSNQHYQRRRRRRPQQQQQQQSAKQAEVCSTAGTPHPVELSTTQQQNSNIPVQTKLECQLVNISCCNQRNKDCLTLEIHVQQPQHQQQHLVDGAKESIITVVQLNEITRRLVGALVDTKCSQCSRPIRLSFSLRTTTSTTTTTTAECLCLCETQLHRVYLLATSLKMIDNKLLTGSNNLARLRQHFQPNNHNNSGKYYATNHNNGVRSDKLYDSKRPNSVSSLSGSSDGGASGGSGGDTENDYEYGPGIVDRLRHKFMALASSNVTGDNSSPPLSGDKRCSSMEELTFQAVGNSFTSLKLARATPSTHQHRMLNGTKKRILQWTMNQNLKSGNSAVLEEDCDSLGGTSINSSLTNTATSNVPSSQLQTYNTVKQIIKNHHQQQQQQQQHDQLLNGKKVSPGENDAHQANAKLLLPAKNFTSNRYQNGSASLLLSAPMPYFKRSKSVETLSSVHFFETPELELNAATPVGAKTNGKAEEGGDGMASSVDCCGLGGESAQHHHLAMSNCDNVCNNCIDKMSHHQTSIESAPNMPVNHHQHHTYLSSPSSSKAAITVNSGKVSTGDADGGKEEEESNANAATTTTTTTKLPPVQKENELRRITRTNKPATSSTTSPVSLAEGQDVVACNNSLNTIKTAAGVDDGDSVVGKTYNSLPLPDSTKSIVNAGRGTSSSVTTITTPSIETSEMPKPDIVKTYKRLFEVGDSRNVVNGSAEVGPKTSSVPVMTNNTSSQSTIKTSATTTTAAKVSGKTNSVPNYKPPPPPPVPPALAGQPKPTSKPRIPERITQTSQLNVAHSGQRSAVTTTPPPLPSRPQATSKPPLIKPPIAARRSAQSSTENTKQEHKPLGSVKTTRETYASKRNPPTSKPAPFGLSATSQHASKLKTRKATELAEKENPPKGNDKISAQLPLSKKTSFEDNAIDKLSNTISTTTTNKSEATSTLESDTSLAEGNVTSCKTTSDADNNTDKMFPLVTSESTLNNNSCTLAKEQQPKVEKSSDNATTSIAATTTIINNKVNISNDNIGSVLQKDTKSNEESETMSAKERASSQVNPSSNKQSAIEIATTKTTTTTTTTAPSSASTSAKPAFRTIKSATNSTGSSSVVFNFRDKKVKPKIAIQPAPFGAKPIPKRIIRAIGAGDVGDDDEDEEDLNYTGSLQMPPPCGISFVGEMIVSGKSNLMTRRNKNLSIQFTDSNVVFEYPLESYNSDEEEVIEVAKERTSITSLIKGNSILGSYKSSKTEVPFQLGITKTNRSPAVDAKEATHAQGTDDIDGDTTSTPVIKPAPYDETVSFSQSTARPDLLF